MATDFSRTLSLLRQEKGISQRKAAGEMGISQALLSHYENGIREPGLAFVVKACDYYHVSADYLLGRTLSRDGAIIGADDLYDSTGEKGTLKGSILATLQKKLVVNTRQDRQRSGHQRRGRLSECGALSAAAPALPALRRQRGLLRRLRRRLRRRARRGRHAAKRRTLSARTRRGGKAPRGHGREHHDRLPRPRPECGAGVPQHGRALQDAVRSAARRLAQAFI